jgi:hypothetical protein
MEYLMRMGQGLFQHPTPDGYPDEAQPWLGSLLWRWNFALALAANEVPSATVSQDRLAHAIAGEARLTPGQLLAYFIGRAGTRAEVEPLEEFAASRGLGDESRAELVGLILASPAFQVC